MRTSKLNRDDVIRPVGRSIFPTAMTKCACAVAIMAVIGVQTTFAQDSSSAPSTTPQENVVAAQPDAPIPAPLEIPSTPLEVPAPANSIPPSVSGDVPVTAPQTTQAPAPTLVPDAPKSIIAVAPPPPPPPTPSDILGLSGKEHAKERARAEKCLANAVYFESRGELMRGQVAVAQVVMNRVFSPYYPKDVCGVVYQNADHHLACQFTFACDGRSKAITERGAWSRAQRVAKQTLDGKVWIAAVAKATHYHAYWVNPSWVAEMKKMYRYGVHTFYRPHRWGDGSHEAGWVVPEMALIKPAENKTDQVAKPVTQNESPKPAATQAKASTDAKPAQAKAAATDSKSKTATPAAQVKTSATDIKAKSVPATAKNKTTSVDSKTKPEVATKPKATATDKTKTLPSSTQAKASQKVTAQ